MSREEESTTNKRVALADLRPGMYVVGLDRSWLQTPFLFHRKLIQRDEEIDQMRKHGIREVVIDIARGVDVVDGQKSDGEITNRPAEEPAVEVKSAAAQRPPSPAELAFQPMVRELEQARTIHDEALTLAQSIFDGAGRGTAIDGEVAGRVVTSLRDSIMRSPEANLLLMQMRRLQNDLFTHAVNVCVLSLVVATVEKLGDDFAALGTAALLHDLGETRLPRSLLRKENNLTETETNLLTQHPILGAALLAGSKDIPAAAQRIIVDHHERIDGSGYPAGETDLTVYTQLVALTDSYDDMLSGRNRAQLQPTEVLRQLYLQANGGTVDRDLVERVIRSLGVYPVGSVVELNTGEWGLVVAANRSSALKPTVRLIMSRSGLMQSNGPIIGLGEAAGDAVERRVVAIRDPLKEGIDPMAFLRTVPGMSA
ncbi:MAG: DUF3391 domain-containing protein [Deltaproteobacteria bacterium]|nr:DUF3391 domain-containing protein [Deltaproteobacteria bacterium]